MEYIDTNDVIEIDYAGIIERYDNTIGKLISNKPKHTLDYCILNDLTYEAPISYNNLELSVPLIVGSKYAIDTYDERLKGYFVIDGVRKTITTQDLYVRDAVGLRLGIMSDGKRFVIEQFGYCYKEDAYGKNRSRWYPPSNLELLLKWSSKRDILLEHLTALKDIIGTGDNIIDEEQQIVIARVFDVWIGSRVLPPKQHKLLTAGDLILNLINLNGSKSPDYIRKCFKSHKWPVDYHKSIDSVSEDLSPRSLIGCISSIRRISSVMSRDNAPVEPRMINKDLRYSVCPVESSEGSIAGMVWYFAQGARISKTGSVVVENKPTESIKSKVLFENGKYSGFATTVSIVDGDVDIHEDDDTIYVYTSQGRYVPNKQNLYSLGYTAMHIPYVTNNPAIRAVYTSNMIKNAITHESMYINGLYHESKWLIAGEQPIKGPHMPTPSGFNAVVAVMPWFGYNIEDAVVISKSLSEKFTTAKLSIVNVQLGVLGILIPIFKRPNYDDNGIVKVGTQVKRNDIIATTYNPKNECVLTYHRATSSGIIDKVVIGTYAVKICIVEKRPIEVGDKITSRHGQKAIVSLILNDDDMPKYCTTHEDPKCCEMKCVRNTIEIIINPHAFPSRMTMGQLEEMSVDGKCFKRIVMTKDWTTNNPVIIGKCFYMALKQQVNDKYMYRNTGLNDPCTLQPLQGRGRMGGLRFGQMEKDALLAVKAYKTLNELFSSDLTKMLVCTVCGVCINECEKHTESVQIRIHQSTKIAIHIFRVLGKDVFLQIKNNKPHAYKITDADFNMFKHVKIKNPIDLMFGIDTVDSAGVLSLKSTKLYVIPYIMRDLYVHNLYAQALNGKKISELKEWATDRLTGKSGVIRGNIEGKTVNHCFRSVIVPRPEIDINEVEIPYKVEIGAECGLLVRQPTLSMRSVMFTKLKKAPGKTLGINPLLCKAFNADFDGDEMNVYGLLSEESICEAKEKLSPIIDEIQDYVTSRYIFKENSFKIGDLKLLELITKYGLTADKEGIELMVKSGAKGKEWNIEHMYNSLGDIHVDDKIIGNVKNSYTKGLSPDEFYLQCQAAREGIISIAINTPVTGKIARMLNRAYENID